MRICGIEGCARGTKAKGYCQTHYRRFRKGQPLDAPINPSFQRFGPGDENRFWAKVNKAEDCWLWTASTINGYGAFSIVGTIVLAHRYSYELAKGPIAPGLVIDHLCMTPTCVNPDHLEMVTVAENTRRGYSGPIGAAYHLAKTHCPHGHPYDAENTAYRKPGWGRICRACSRERDARRRAA